MLALLKDILDNREDAYARALAAAEEDIAQTGGGWFGVGAKGSFLMLRSGGLDDPEQALPYARAGRALLDAALVAAAGQHTVQSHLLHFLAGCAIAGAAPHDGQLAEARTQFEFSDMGRAGLPDWCADWCRILLASAAMASGDEHASALHFRHVADRDPARAAALFECWSRRGT